MRTALVGWWLLASLVAHVSAHVALVVRVARSGKRARAVAAFFVMPLAAVWGWEAGAKRWTVVWLGGLAGWILGLIAASVR
jgi:hypothetical protein